MKSRIILMFAMLIISLCLLSCIVTSRAIGVEISCDEFNDSPQSIRNEFEVEIGDKITVRLCANPTTGHQWQYETTGDVVLKEEDHDFEEPQEENLVGGAAGQEVWTFEAVEEGTTQLRMEYSRPWEGGEKAEWIYTMTVTVE